MDKAKQAVSEFISKSGHHDTTVHEHVAPTVEHETVAPHEREERQIATDREVHQYHHHTSVQPIKDREVLPEQHHHILVPVEHRSHDHRNKQETEARVERDAAQFKDETVRAAAHHTSATAPAVVGEHVHHHIHETIQPVVHKQTIEPHVIHTTVPIHEVHHNAAQHHATSQLPAVTMEEFKKRGGSLTGREERIDHFSGEPKSIENTLGTHDRGGILGNTSSASKSHDSIETGSGIGGNRANAGAPRVAGSLPKPIHNRDTVGSSPTANVGSGMTGTHGSTNSAGQSHATTGVSDSMSGPRTRGMTKTSSGSSSSSTGRKASLLDKLNPMKDADGDGKRGFMD